MILNVPAVGDSVPSAMSIVASTGDVASLPVSTQIVYLFVVAVIVDSDGSAVSNSTRAFPVSRVVVMLAKVTSDVPDALDEEMSLQ